MIKEADVRAVLERNLLSTILVCQQVARGMMARRRGRILTISSIAAFKGREHGAIYATAKAGVVHYTRCLADQLRPVRDRGQLAGPRRHPDRPLPQYPHGRPGAPGGGRHAGSDRHRRRGRARGGILRRPARRLRLRPGAAGRRRLAVLAGVRRGRRNRARPDARRVRPVPPSPGRRASVGCPQAAGAAGASAVRSPTR